MPSLDGDEGQEFERRLGRLFDAAPGFADDALFAARVQSKFEARDQVRRVVMGMVGGAGAFVAAAQLVGANFTAEIARASARSGDAVEQGLATLNRDALSLLATTPMGGEVLWTAAALGALALGFLATRLADQD